MVQYVADSLLLVDCQPVNTSSEAFSSCCYTNGWSYPAHYDVTSRHWVWFGCGCGHCDIIVNGEVRSPIPQFQYHTVPGIVIQTVPN